MLTRIWERLPFSEGTARRAYLDSAPLSYELEDPVKSTNAVRKENRPQQAKIEQPVSTDVAIARIRAERDEYAQRLQRLEAMLADPERGQNAILYFRLRGIWDLCNNDLMALSRQFRDKYVSADGQSNETEATRTETAIDTHTARYRAAQARVTVAQQQIKKLEFDLYKREKPFKVGEKQFLTHALTKARKERDAATQQFKILQRQESSPVSVSTPAPRPAPAPSNGKMLTVQTKRAINITLIALAQHFYLAYREEQIADMALRASQKSVDEVNFGLASECLALGNKIRELVAQIKNESNRHETVRKRVEYLKDKLRYASDSDAIPEKHSLNSIPTRVATKEGLFSNLGDELPVNVLALNYWDINRALLK